ncbi:MAG: ferridoxin [Desulfobacterales bacterium]|nr:ferridoxin [Desulfobacterales bacterium]
MSLFIVDQEQCAKDGVCIGVCPMGLIKPDDNKIPQPVEHAEMMCIHCGHCVAACPKDCFEHKNLKRENFPLIQKELEISSEEGIQFLRKRRSTREFKEKEIPKDELVKLIENARYAPSGHNLQGAQWHVINGKDKVRKIAELMIEWAGWMVENKPDFATMMGLDIGIKKWEAGEDMVLRDAPALIIAHAHKKDVMSQATCTIALTYLELAATTMGLGTCWAGFLQMAANSYEPLQKALGLPDDHAFNGGMMVGYPKFKYRRVTERKQPVITWSE